MYFIFFFFFNDTATTEIYTLSLHDALPTSPPTATPKPCNAGSTAEHLNNLRFGQVASMCTGIISDTVSRPSTESSHYDRLIKATVRIGQHRERIQSVRLTEIPLDTRRVRDRVAERSEHAPEQGTFAWRLWRILVSPVCWRCHRPAP